MTKRQKFVFTSIALSLGFIGIQFLDNQYKFAGIGILTLFTFLLFVWSLREGLGRNATLLVLTLPTYFTLGVGLFWFLLPATLFARLPVIFLYGLGIYALCLTSNIFTVAAIRTIALARAAKGVGFVITLLAAFLIFDAIFSVKGEISFNTISIAALSFPLFLQGLWTSQLEKTLQKNVMIYSLVFSFILAEIAIVLYFWSVTVVVASLFLTVGVYMMLGLGQSKIENRLFSQTVREYLSVGILVFLGMFFTMIWSG